MGPIRGSIIKNEGKRKTTYSVMFWMTDPTTGQRKQKKKTFKTKKEAEKYLNNAIVEVEKGIFADPGKMIVSEYLDRWFETHKINLSPKTVARYEGIIKLHIVPRIGHMLLQKINPLSIQELLHVSLINGRQDNKKTVGKNLSGSSVRQIYLVLRKALGQAVAWGLLSNNPCDRVKAPRPTHKEITILDKGQINLLLAQLEGKDLYMPVFLAIYTGMRLGEVLGLTWDAVDFENRVIRVKQSSCQVNVDKPIFKQPKTTKGRRAIEITQLVVEKLESHKQDQDSLKEEANDCWQNYNLVFCHRDGRPINPPTFSSSFIGITKKLGLKINFHSLRHTHASMLLIQKVPLKVVSERLGHGSVSVTGDIYSHLIPGLGQEAAQSFEKYLEENKD